MNSAHSLQALLNNTASDEDIELLKHLLASGEISIGGNVNQSVIIIGSGNTVELPPEALDRLNARPMLGNLDRDLTGEEITLGLRRLEKLLPNRAPVLILQFKATAARLRPTLKTEIKSLSESACKERVEALAVINSICVEALDVSFNGLSLGEEAPKYDARSPFRGLESFRPADSEFFFGREALTEKLVRKIKAHSFLAVLGASGSGKSSLVMAGVIPALDSDYVIFRPGTNPLGELESARGKSLIVVDQFEELFTLTRDESARKDFIARLLDESSRARIILTLRSDFLGEVGAYRTLSAEIQSHLEIIPPMDMDELRRAMEGQAGVVGLRFEADLSQQILDDVAGEPGAMPLLQHALWELWNRRHGRNLRALEYRAFGGVKQAITSTAEKAYTDCSKPEQDQLRDIFLRLTRLDDGDEGRDTRRRVPLGDLIPSGRDAASITLLLDKLANARLIVKTVNDDKTEVEVAHEALIRHWERLRIWLNEDRDALRLRESVSESAKEWERSGRHESLLNSRWVKLEEALLLAQDSRYQLTEIEQAYLTACISLRNKEQREQERRLRYTVFASIIAAIFFLILGGFALLKSTEATLRANDAATAQAKAEQQAEIALSNQLIAQSQFLKTTGNSDNNLALLLAILSLKIQPSFEGRQFLQDITVASLVANFDHDGAVKTIAISNNNKYLAIGTSGNDNSIYIWEIATKKMIAQLHHLDGVISVMFSPDGKFVISGGLDNTIRVWKTISGEEVTQIKNDSISYPLVFSPNGIYAAASSNYDGIIRVWDIYQGVEISQIYPDMIAFPNISYIAFIAFSPDGKYILSGGNENTVRISDIQTGRMIYRLNHDAPVSSGVFSSDGKYIVSGSYDNTARVWEADTGIEISRMTHLGPVLSVSFSPDGKYILSTSEDHTARIWDTLTGAEVSRTTHLSSVLIASFSQDGRYVASAGADNLIRLWDVATGSEVARIQHGGSITSIVYSANGKYIISGSSDRTVRVWEVNSRREISRLSHEDYITDTAFSSDGKYIVSGSSDGTARVWETFTGKELSRMDHDRVVSSVAFSPDAKYVASISLDDTLRVWESATGKETARMYYYEGNVHYFAFSPDGKYVILGSWNKKGWDETVHVWQIDTGQEVISLTLHQNKDSVVISPEGKYKISQTTHNSIVIQEVSTGDSILEFTNDGSLNSIAFSKDEKYAGGVWEMETDIFAFHVWAMETGQEIAEIINNESPDLISPDEKYKILISGDNSMHVVEISTEKEVYRVTLPETITLASFSPNNKYILTGSTDKKVRVWYWRTEELIDDACSRMSRNLTRAEWDQYIGDALPYQAVCPNLPIEPEPTPTP